MPPLPGAKSPSKAPAALADLPDAEFSRERLLVYGKEGAGKSQAWLSIAAEFPEVPFFVIDTDDSVQRLLETDFSELKNIHTRTAQTWEEFEAAALFFLGKIHDYVAKNPIQRREDYPWLVIDFADATWDMCQSYFTEQVFNKGIEEYFLEARKKLRGGQLQPLEGWTDWQVINKLYQSRFNTLTKSGGHFHLYMTAKSAKVGTDADVRTLYRALKAMPGGEKRMSYRVHTVIMASVDAKGWFMSSAKDRGRELMDDKRIQNFCISYLVKIAGWVLPE